MYSGYVDVREEEREDEAPDEARGGCGDVEVAKSSVATSSVSTTGFPQEEQKRTFDESSVPQNTQFDIGILRYRITHAAAVFAGRTVALRKRTPARATANTAKYC